MDGGTGGAYYNSWKNIHITGPFSNPGMAG
jgi:hypothetical protein